LLNGSIDYQPNMNHAIAIFREIATELQSILESDQPAVVLRGKIKKYGWEIQGVLREKL
jgi:hypothetical protein